VIVRPRGGEGLTRRMLLTELDTNTLSALLTALVLSQIRVGVGCGSRVGVATLLGLFAFVTVLRPYWNRYSLPRDFLATEAIGHVVGRLLGGPVPAAIVRAPKTPAAAEARRYRPPV
jgi:hypothetical protein